MQIINLYLKNSRASRACSEVSIWLVSCMNVIGKKWLRPKKKNKSRNFLRFVLENLSLEMKLKTTKQQPVLLSKWFSSKLKTFSKHLLDRVAILFFFYSCFLEFALLPLMWSDGVFWTHFLLFLVHVCQNF